MEDRVAGGGGGGGARVSLPEGREILCSRVNFYLHKSM